MSVPATGQSGQNGPVTKQVDQAQLDVAREAATQQGETLGGPFAPGIPLTPYDGVSGLPRAWNFPTGYNIKARADRDGRIDFALLKVLCESYDVAGMCINHRIDDVRSLTWTIRSADWVTVDNPAEIDQARQAMKKPDGRTPFRAWLAMYLQDVLRYDAGALYKRRTNAGKCCGLEVISGTTIAPVLDYWGRTPLAPAPAYVQYISGQPWEWLTTDDLIYVPFRPQSDSPYGFAPLEHVLLTANTDMRFQKHFLDWFTEGNIPEGFATAPADVSTPEMLEKWQAYWESMNTDSRVKHKLKMIPNGTQLEFPTEKKFDPTFPLYLMRKVCAIFHVTPNDLGFTEDVNRATGDTQVDVQFRIGTLPLVQHVQDILTSYLQDDLGLAVVFEFDTGQEKEDRYATAQADAIYIQNGVVSVDEVRERQYGLATDAERPTPRFIFSARQGPIPLRSLLDVAGAIDPETAAPSDLAPLDTAAFVGTPGVLPDKSPGSPQFAKAPTDPDEPRRPELELPVPGSGIVGAPPAAPAPVAQPDPLAKSLTDAAVRELAQWRSNTVTRLSRGKAPRPFEPVVMDPDLVEAVWKQLRHVNTREQADAVFDQVRKATKRRAKETPNPKWTALDPKGPASNVETAEDADQEAELGNQEDVEAGDLPTDMDHSVSDEVAEDEELTELELSPQGAGQRAYRSETDSPTPQQVIDQKLADHWSKVLSVAMADIASGKAAETLAHAAMGDDPMIRARIARVADFTHTRKAVESMWANGYTSGTMAAQQSLGRTPTVSESGWKPYDNPQPPASDLGWRSVMAGAGQVLSGIEGTMLDGIASVLDHGVKDGLSVDQLADGINGYLSDPSRAYMIAQTESAHMLTTASMNLYRAEGLTKFDLVVSDGACDICIGYAQNGPYDTYDDADGLVPVHPRCRCSVAPHDTGTGVGVDVGDRTVDLSGDPNQVTLDGESVPIITAADGKRGDAQPVTRAQFALDASDGKQILDGLKANASPITGLLDNLDSIKDSTYAAVQESWGGATIDSHTGQALASDADKYAITAKPAGVESVSVPENPTREEWGAAVDKAVARFGDTLTAQSYHLGVFHDDDLGRIDLDPVVVMDTKKESNAVGAYTHNVGGAYNFKDGNGYWPPYVDEADAEAKAGGADFSQRVDVNPAVAKAAGDVLTHFKGIGQWYAQNRRLNAGEDNGGEDDGDV